jgi:hypothetical protein
MCAAGVTVARQTVEEAIHVVGGGRVIGEFVTGLDANPTGDTLDVDNKYYRASIPLRRYACLADVPECISGALVLVLVAEDGPGTGNVGEASGMKDAFDGFTSWWAARDGDEVEVRLIAAWGVGSEEEGEGGMGNEVFAWCGEEGFELVYCPDKDGDVGLATEELARETSGVDRVREALQHYRWSMAEMKAVPSRSGLGSDEAFPDDDEPSWKRMNDDVLGAFSRLAACGSDSDDDAEETFAALASMLRR